mmetsp:Transcript_16104/g.24352  ORF Transcript_16104/g.24352 Transcript_16104/m.24352 type:complete len:559 (+) Transcript_16104:67-1743(+)
MSSSTTRIQMLIIFMLVIISLVPFLLPLYQYEPNNNINLKNKNRANGSQKLKPAKQSTNALNDKKWKSFLNVLHSGAAQSPHTTRACEPGACAPLRYFATNNNVEQSQQTPLYYIEPNLDATGRNGMFASIPSRPWHESSITPLDPYTENANDLVRTTMERRYNDLVQSDSNSNNALPKFLPPQFPQWDRSIHEHIVAPDAAIIGMPPECCPTSVVHQHLTKNFSKDNVLSEEELKDCTCRSPRNYPIGNDGENINRPTATLVTAFYEMSSKHPRKMYEKTSLQLLSTADPMIIFCEPKSTWVKFFTEKRQHAPTIVVPMSVSNLRLLQHFPQETFWKKQFEIDPEGTTHHKSINTKLYLLWDEKIVLLQSAAMLNPFNTTQFVWVDTGYWRNPAPHMYRQSAMRINMTKEGVTDESMLLYQMQPYNFDREVVISGDQVLVGGNCFSGTYNGIANMYSAFYETFWAMAATGKFVGSDQKVLYRTCHTYPSACHIHKPPKGYRKWLNMLGLVLPDLGEKVGEPLKLTSLIEPLKHLPIPPNCVVDDATSTTVWKDIPKD